jgi:hypothetical protein
LTFSPICYSSHTSPMDRREQLSPPREVYQRAKWARPSELQSNRLLSLRLFTPHPIPQQKTIFYFLISPSQKVYFHFVSCIAA